VNGCKRRQANGLREFIITQDSHYEVAKNELRFVGGLATVLLFGR